VREGTLYKHILEKQTPFTTTQKLSIAADIGSALAHMHEKGLFHRNIRLRKILLNKNFNARLTGKGKIRNSPASNNNMASVVGNTRNGAVTNFQRALSMPIKDFSQYERDELVYLAPEVLGWFSRLY
jgi:serine/threonine protein kinase